ncbi:MAG: SDR family oxidoreductase [Oscillochloris sp.]|nr:SDR family oxidoreductase [Oscillochloris sp.]
MSDVGNVARLDGKIALITGEAGNIGEAITRRYLAVGATVVVAGWNAEQIEHYRSQLLTELSLPPERLLAVRMDGREISEVRTGLAEIVARFGQIDILINHAGFVGSRQRLIDLPLRNEKSYDDTIAALDDSINTVIGATWNFIRVAAPHMHAGSSLINISTICMHSDSYGHIPYVVPSATLRALTFGVTNELGERGVRVNQINLVLMDDNTPSVSALHKEDLKGLPERQFDKMRLRHSDAEGNLARRSPQAIDVANAAVFLGSDESAALSGETFNLTHGIPLPLESATTLTARPGLRAVDGSGHVTLICAGNQIEEAMALIGVLRSCGAEAVIGFRSRATIARLEHIFEEGRNLSGRDYIAPILLYLNPSEPESVDAALRWMTANIGAPSSAVILAARSDPLPPSIVAVSDDDVTTFLADDLVGSVALARQLARFWGHTLVAPGAEAIQPRVLFLSNADDSQGNLYADMLRVGIEQLIRVWRHESHVDHAAAAQTADGVRYLPPIWANQLVRYRNAEAENVEYACAWAAKLLLSERTVEAISLYLPESISATTGTKQPSFGWAESLIGLHLGKTALITGGSAGIGGQIGRLLALSGARVMLAARDADKLSEMRDFIIRELREVGYNRVESRVQIFPNCDVADESQLVALVRRTLDLFGHVDYLINNAGIAGAEEMVIDLALNDWERTLNANLISNYSLIRKLAPLMKAQGSGYILNVSSYFGGEKHAAIAYPNRADYAVSKAGQRALVEALARLLGPEVQINALAPGPVEGERLRGSGDRPGLFMRRARLILENKRLNDLHAALIEAYRARQGSMAELLAPILNNQVQPLAEDASAPSSLRNLARLIREQSDPQAFSYAYFMNQNIARKLLARFVTGGLITVENDAVIHASLNAQSSILNPQPATFITPEPFFTRAQIEREARKVRDGIMSMLYLQRMPTEFDVAMATIYYLSDRNVSGETFHPSGGLRYERTPTGTELFGSPSAARLARLAGTTVYLIGEHLGTHLEALARAYLERYAVAQVVLICETGDGADALHKRLADHSEAGVLHIIAAGDALEQAIDTAIARFGPPGPIICTPFQVLPAVPLVGRNDSDWSTVLGEDGFATICAQQITHHFRVAHKVALIDGVALVMVTPETSSNSSTEQFALANFVKTTLHAFTATLGVECERTVHRILANQVDLARQARAEEPRSSAEQAQEIERFIDAVLLTTAPLPLKDDSRYIGRIHRGRAITV